MCTFKTWVDFSDSFTTTIGMARPPKPAKERKDSDLRIPVTSEQKDVVMAAARAEGLDMAAWARQLLVREARAALDRPKNRSR